MPNWCETKFEILLPKESKEEFLSLFLSFEQDNSTKDKYLARTFIESVDEIPYSKNENFILLSISCNCAWSVTTCWVDGYPQESDKCQTMEKVCKELKVKHLIGSSQEPGMAFIENFEYRNKKFHINARDMSHHDLRANFDDYEEWEDFFMIEDEEEM